MTNNTKDIIEQANKLFKKRHYQQVIDLLLPVIPKMKSGNTKRILTTVLAKSYYKNENTDIALEYFVQLIAEHPKESQYFYLAGICEMSLNHHPQAQSYFKRCLALNPGQSNCQLNIAASYRHTNQPEQAIPYYNELRHNPDYASRAFRNLAMCQKYDSLDQPDIKAIFELLQEGELTSEQRSHLYFALGKIYKDCNMHSYAFESYTYGNQLKNKSHAFNHTDYSKKIDNLKKIFSDITYPKPKQKSESALTFIIGIPRGGKTLLEKTLLLSNQAFALEEFAALDKLVYQYTNNKPFQFSSELQSHIQSKKFGKKLYQDFIGKIQQRTQENFQAYVDTTPCNFRYMGYILLMCPNAKFIHTYRNPLDHIFVAYTKYFASGNFWAFNIENIVHYYCEYRRIMAFWEKSLPTKIKTIIYEDLIKNPEPIARALFEFVGIEVPNNLSVALNTLNIHDKEINIHQQYPEFMEAIAPFMAQLQPYMPK
tara:strand:- start:26156 stop:27604 length:1449 start_codon:yes stop_codon:yes gene_type:complete